MTGIYACLAPEVVGPIVGIIYSVVVGGVFLNRFYEWHHRDLPRLDEPVDTARVPQETTGALERLIFTLAVIVYPNAALPGMLGWLTLKMAANWNKNLPPTSSDPVVNRDQQIFRNRHAFLGLLTGFLSMAFAGAGGLLARAIMDKDILL